MALGNCKLYFNCKTFEIIKSYILLYCAVWKPGDEQLLSYRGFWPIVITNLGLIV